ncbi:AzlD domain-containing protein [Paenibacillus sp. GCM10027627]|uniref:AzlD domain-containing protein n=1 Tax=unclassified Paenibacillus TaxID=185978 RepID=UPI00363BDF9B
MWIVFAMGLITFLLRFTPLLLVEKVDAENKKVKSHWFVDNLPLAVLSALVVPGIFQVDETTPWVGLTAGIVAVGLVLLKKVPLVVIIAVSVAAAYFVKQLI